MVRTRRSAPSRDGQQRQPATVDEIRAKGVVAGRHAPCVSGTRSRREIKRGESI